MGKRYSTHTAAQAAGVSEGSVRNYLREAAYAGIFSQGAYPPPGQARQLTDQDVTLLGYIREQTAAGLTHHVIAAQIGNGALAGFVMPAEHDQAAGDQDLGHDQAAPQDQPAALVLLLRDELTAARTREQALYDRLIVAESRAAAAESQASALREQLDQVRQAARPASWWRRLLGV